MTITGSFSNPLFSTLVMTGAGTNLSVTPQIGNLTVSGSVTLLAALSMTGTMTISGTFIDSTTNSLITLGGDWNNTGTFSSGTCTVKFTNSSVQISGATTWYVFDYEVPGGIVHFQENCTQTIASGGKFKVIWDIRFFHYAFAADSRRRSRLGYQHRPECSPYVAAQPQYGRHSRFILRDPEVLRRACAPGPRPGQRDALVFQLKHASSRLYLSYMLSVDYGSTCGLQLYGGL